MKLGCKHWLFMSKVASEFYALCFEILTIFTGCYNRIWSSKSTELMANVKGTGKLKSIWSVLVSLAITARYKSHHATMFCIALILLDIILSCVFVSWCPSL